MEKVISRFQSLGRATKYLLILAAGVAILSAVLLIIFSGSGKNTINIETSLKDIISSSELRTAEYTYNSIAEVKEGDTVKYHAAYKGTVSVGFDFSGVDIQRNGNVIQLTVPELEIQSTEVGTDIEFIFVKEKYNTENCYAEAYSVCEKDLTEKALASQALFDTAKDSAENTMRALIKPFEEHLEDGQTIEIVFADDRKEEA